MSHRRRFNTSPFQPARRRISRLSRVALSTSVSVASLLLAGIHPAMAQQAGTLPGTAILQGGRWVGAKLPTVAQGNNGMVMTIEQEQKRALLDWSRFDVAKNEEVHFKQDGVDWIALNRIFDSKPSEIAGKITAKGQVWLQNTNGIVFKDGAKVNAHSILATALTIRDDQLYNGLTSGNGVIRNSVLNPLYGQNMGSVGRPPVGLDPRVWLELTPVPVGGQQRPTIELLAERVINVAVGRDNGTLDPNASDAGMSLGLQSLSYYDLTTGANTFLIDPKFAHAGLYEVLENVIAGVDLSKMGDSGAIPDILRSEVAAQIKAQYVDKYSTHLAAAQQNFANYVANSRVVVEKGATLTAASSDSASPGKIMLFGPNVSNAGTLTAHDGQVLMAAGEQIKLNGGQSFTNSARGGLAVNVMATAIVDSAGSYPGMPCCRPETYAAWNNDNLERANAIGMTASNSGSILADRGAVTMAGANVDQLGSILVTNGVRQRNGTIVLQASHGFVISDYSVGGNYFAGSLTLGENSVTRITPDTSDLTGLAADTFTKGKILLAGKDILLDRGAEVTSRSGEIIIHANPSGSGERGGSSPAATDGIATEQRGNEGSFIMRSGATIDVSGLTDVERSVADNFFEVEVRSNEVSASPKQRDGILIGETVNVDRREGSTIVDWTGALAGEQRTAQQMSTEGGTVRIRASEFAIIEDGATIDVSGGSTKYTDAQITVTRLRDATGRFHDISTADSNRVYTGINQATRLEQGYVEGADAGSVEILSGSARLFGKLKGDVITGERQLLAALGQIAAPRMPAGAVGADYVTTAGLPKAGEAVLHRGGPEYGAWTSAYSFIVADENPFTATLWTEDEPNGTFFESGPILFDPMSVGTSISADGAYADYDPETDPLWHSNGLYENGQPRWASYIEDDFFSGMGSVSLSYGSGHQTQAINPGVSIQLAPGGGFSMSGEGGVSRMGDNVSIIAPSGKIQMGSGNGTTLGRGISLSVAAPWINDADAPTDAIRGYVNGGEIALFGAKLTGGIELDAGGGGWYQRLSPPTRTSVGQFKLIEGKGGTVTLGGGGQSVGEILGFADISVGGLGGGGTLSLLAGGNVVIGPEGGSSPGFEYLDDTLFRDMGVGTLDLQADSIRLVEGANLLFQARNMQFGGRAYDVATGTDLRDVTDLVLLPDHLRTGGTLRLTSRQIAIDEGALVEVDPLGRIELGSGSLGTGNYTVEGTLRAHGGAIVVGQGGGNVHLGNNSLLDATGIAQTVKVPGGADGRGFWYDGRIVDGGSVTVNADYATMDAGAAIDVSGTSGLLSVYAPGRYSLIKVNQTIGSDAGTIDLRAAGGYLLGNLRGEAGSIYNYGGRLIIGGGRDGDLIMPGNNDWQTGAVGIESILQNLQYAFWPEPSPEAPVSLRDLFANNYSWLVGQLGFGPGDIEDIQITSIAEFQDFVRTALVPITMQAPEDIAGAFILDPTMTMLPDAPPASGEKFAVPEGFTPTSATAFERAMIFILQSIGGVQKDPSQFVRGARMTAGANILRDMKTFDSLAISGKLESDHKIDISSKRELHVGGGFNGVNDMSFSSRNVYLGGIFPQGQTAAEAVSGTLTISGETVQIGSAFAVGGFEKVVISAEGDMRGGYGNGNIPVAEEGDNTPGVSVTGDLVLRAAQIYPTTDGVLRFDAGRSIRVERTGRRDAPLSAGGLLILNAPKIEQAGTLRAPFGEIRLTAAGTTTLGEDGVETYTPGVVSLLPGSVTSTSADGRTILYGYTYDGQSWYAPTGEPGDPELSTPPEKRVSLTGDLIDVQDGATIDVSGSGDVLGLEFVAGPLGQTNVLNESGVYAIVPAYGDRIISPIDPLYNSNGYSEQPGTSATEIGIGSAVWLAAFDGNPAGWYTLLPAEYALTPGGYSIKLSDNIPTVPDARELADKSFAVLGRQGMTGTTIADQTLSTFRLERGTDVRNRSEFYETYGNSFFSSERFLEGLLRSGNAYNANPRLPIDGGFLTLAANSSLKLDGTIRASGDAAVKDARGGIVDITSDNIVIAAPGTDVSDLEGYLVLDPAKISGIAESLLIGGVRRQGITGLEILVGHETRAQGETERTPERSVGAENVVIRTDAANPLTGTELLFAANQSVRVESGAVVRATGDGAAAVNLSIAPSMPVLYNQWNPTQVDLPAEDRGGAFLRVSNLGDVTVSRTNVQSVSGDMIVEAGAVLEATDAILLDSTENTIVGNGATIKAGSITAAAGLVSLGEVPQGAEGLVFTGATLEGLTQAAKLTLKSYSTFDFYGDVSLNLSEAAVLDGAALVARGDTPGTVNIAAGTLEIRNSDAAPADAVGVGGALTLGGTNIVFGEGDIDLAFTSTNVEADERVIFSGLGDNNFDGALTIRAAEVTGASGAGHTVRAAGDLKLHSGEAAAELPALATAGALLDFIGQNVDIATTVRAGSGTVRATAETGDVRLSNGGLIDVAGSDVSFFEVQGFLPGGGVQLTSVQGDVVMAEGSAIDISGGDAGGDAGTLVLSAGRGVAKMDGAVRAEVAGEYRGGRFGLTTSTLEDFGGLNALLNDWGISRSRDFAILDGDVVLNGTTRTDALRIVTGTGDIAVAADAVIGSDSAKGGSILLASGGNLSIADGARFDVNAKGADQRGGSVELQVATGGSIDVGAASFDVAGRGVGQGGQVRLRAPQVGNDVGVAGWGATVTGGDTQLEAFRVYDLADADGDAGNGHLAEIDTALQQQVIGDATAFMTANANAIRARLGQNGNAGFGIVPGIELRSEGGIDLVNHWNLKDARFDGRAGVLTLRAGGDLLINANLSDGFNSATATPDQVNIENNNLPWNWTPGMPGLTDERPAEDFTNDNSWSYNLVAGADFAQTNVLATQAGGVGDVEVGGLVRTGTGDINVAAGGDMTYEPSTIVNYQFSYYEGTRITIPAGTPIADGTVLKPTTYNLQAGGTHTIYPTLPAGTVLRKGTTVPAGTVLPDGTTLSTDTVLMADVTLTSETTFPGEVIISGKTRLGADIVFTVPSLNSGDPLASSGGWLTVSLPGMGDVVDGVGGLLYLADGRRIEDEGAFDMNDTVPIEFVNGSIYTVGVEDGPLANFTERSHVGFQSQGAPGMVINPTYLTNGGDVAINVGGAITGAGAILQNYRWLAAEGQSPTTSLYGYGYTGHDPDAPFTSEFVNYQYDTYFPGQTQLSVLADRFSQGVGALGGGDISITSGGTVDNLLVALPTTVRVAGGTEAMPEKTLHLSGGGDLVMSVGQNLKGGLIQLGKGTATIDVAGSVMATDQRTVIDTRASDYNYLNSGLLHLAIDDVQLNLQAGGDIALREISSTLYVNSQSTFLPRPDNTRAQWLGYTEDTSVRVTSLGGDIVYAGNGVDILPSQSAFVATAGSITFGVAGQNNRMIVDMWPDTRLDILAQQDVHFRLAGSYDGAGLTIGYADPLWVPRAINPGAQSVNQFANPSIMQDSLTGHWMFNQAGPGFGIDGANVHSGSTSYSRIYATKGDMIGWHTGTYEGPLIGNGMHGGTYTFGHETRLKAGGDVRMGEITFIQHDGADVSTIEAGGSIYTPNATLYGPGRLWVQAGDEVWMGRTNGKGIRAREAYSTVSTAAPVNGGSITVLAGIDQEPEYQAFFDYYLDPENIAQAPSWLRQYFVDGEREGLTVSTPVVLADGKTQTTVYAIELVNYMRGMRGQELIEIEAPDAVSGSRPITRGALAAEIDPAEYAEALAAFKALDPVLQRPLAVKIINAELKTAGREAVGRSPETDGRYVRQGDPTRGYDAIGRLFPGAQRKPGEALAEGEHAWTGNIDMMVSQIRGESGGDVDLIVPGGSIQLASLSIANTSPGDAGIVTQRGGGVNAIAYGDYIVNQSRTMTADDGDILIWSSYGNIDAGRGRKSSLSVPPVAFPIDQWGQTRVQLSGLPNGAGIATLDQVDGKQGGDVDLYAFNGIVNAGDAGIRASRDLFVGAIEIRGLDNITVGGETNVDLSTEEGSVGPLNLENFAQSAEDDALNKAFDMAAEVEKLRTVRQTILTGSVVSFGTDDCVDTDTRRCPAER